MEWRISIGWSDWSSKDLKCNFVSDFISKNDDIYYTNHLQTSSTQNFFSYWKKLKIECWKVDSFNENVKIIKS